MPIYGHAYIVHNSVIFYSDAQEIIIYQIGDFRVGGVHT